MVEFDNLLSSKEIKDIAKLPSKVCDMIDKKNLTISVAESVSGGDICATITKIPGASKYFIGGIVAYSNILKANDCMVDPKTIIKYGPVSSQTTLEMANGLYKKYQTNICVATTGFAGPQTNNEEVGNCFIALSLDGDTNVQKNKFSGTREDIIKQVTFTAFELIKYHLTNFERRN